MAQKVTAVLEDDLTGGPAGQTIRFAFEDTGYEIDLNAKNAATFSAQLAPCLAHARRAGRAQSTTLHQRTALDARHHPVGGMSGRPGARASARRVSEERHLPARHKNRWVVIFSGIRASCAGFQPG